MRSSVGSPAIRTSKISSAAPGNGTKTIPEGIKIKDNRWVSIGLPALYLAAITLLLYRLFSEWAYDDPFITFRYAENIASGTGFVYNAGEQVLSTTTPFFSLLLAALKPLGADLPTLAIWIGAASIGAGALFIWDISRSWETPILGWTALALYPTSALVVSTLSSETPLYLALCLGAFAAYTRRAYVPAAVLIALAALTRPDGLILAGLLIAHYIVTQRGLVSWKAAAAFSLPLLIWAVFAWLYFGSPVPVTLTAKQGQGLLENSRSFFEGLLVVFEGYATRTWPLVFAALFVMGLVRLVQKRRWLLFLAWPAAYLAAYILLGVTSYFWYYAPLLPGLVVLVGLGLDGLAGWPANRGLISQRAGSALVLALILVAATFQVADLRTLSAAPDPRRPAYQAVGEWLRANIDLSASVGTLEVGIIGYYAGNPMLDFSGLIQPEVSQRFSEEATYEDAALWAVDNFQPDYLVLHQGLMPRLEAAYDELRCTVVFVIYGEAYGYSHDLGIYDCR